LLAFWMGSCGIKRTYPNDRFGGGISGSKPIHNSTKAIAEKIPDLVSEKASQTEGKFVTNKILLSEKQQQKINSVVQDLPALKFGRNKNKILQDINYKISHKQHDKQNPKILKQAKIVFIVASSMLLLGWFFQTFFGYLVFNVGSILIGLSLVLLGISFVMALTGWLNKTSWLYRLIKNKSKGKITFWQVLGGLFLLFLLVLVILLSQSSGGGMFSPF
jgi:hypothetical protein